MKLLYSVPLDKTINAIEGDLLMVTVQSHGEVVHEHEVAIKKTGKYNWVKCYQESVFDDEIDDCLVLIIGKKKK